MADNEKPAKAGKGAPDGADEKPAAEKKAKPARAAKAKAGGDAKPAVDRPKDPNYEPRLKAYYRETVRPALVSEFGYKNPMQVPRVDKIVLNMGVGEATADSKKVTAALADLARIAGQKPAVTRSRKSIATFKLRENMPIGGK